MLFLLPVAAAASLVHCATFTQPPPEEAVDFGLSPAEIADLLDTLDVSTRSVLVGAGDIARCDAIEPAAATATLVEAIVEAAAAAVVFTAGDHAYDRGTQQEFERCYAPTWGRFEEITRPTPGNHDYDTDEAAPYFEYFSFFDGNAEARMGGYYSYQFAGWHIVALNSLIPMEEGSAQLEWLEQDLREADAECILAYWHHPLFSSGLRSLIPWYAGRDAEAVWDVLAAFDAELVLNGHEHFYERFLPQNSAGEIASDGIPQLTVGTGGGDLQSRVLNRDNRAVLYTEGYGVLALFLEPAGYEFAFIGTDGAVHDRSDGLTGCNG